LADDSDTDTVIHW